MSWCAGLLLEKLNWYILLVNSTEGLNILRRKFGIRSVAGPIGLASADGISSARCFYQESSVCVGPGLVAGTPRILG